MKVVKEIFLTEEEKSVLKKATEILDFLSKIIDDNGDSAFSYRSPVELDKLLESAHDGCFEDY